MSLDPGLQAVVEAARQSEGLLVFLTGAGVSAESGIPTFRGEDGYWTLGSRVYRPMELAKWAAFSHDPELVWPWYLYRRSVCRAAEPNPAHLALAQIEQHLGDRFVLVTQNVDGLHLRAGNSLARTWQIHGNIDFMRCAKECSSDLHPVPDLEPVGPGTVFDHAWKEALSCAACGSWARPHVLWWDECYDEKRYRYHSAQIAADRARMLVVVGTSGQASLPWTMSQIAHAKSTPIIDINPDHSPFAEIAEQGSGGWISAPATQGVGWIRDALISD
jgi:NAD-dependent deacetylase